MCRPASQIFIWQMVLFWFRFMKAGQTKRHWTYLKLCFRTGKLKVFHVVTLYGDKAAFTVLRSSFMEYLGK
jgi:hypothetical protein